MNYQEIKDLIFNKTLKFFNWYHKPKTHYYSGKGVLEQILTY